MGSTVTITVNDGPKSAAIPGNLVGRDVDDVEDALNKAGFGNVNRVAATSEGTDSREGEVLTVNPSSGTTAPIAVSWPELRASDARISSRSESRKTGVRPGCASRSARRPST